MRAPVIDSPPLFRYGLPELVFGASPAAATDFVQAVEGRYFTRLLSVFARLVTDANVANRELVLEYRDPQGLRWMLTGSAVTQAASLTIDYVFDVFRDVVTSLSDSTQLIPAAPHLLSGGMDFRLHIVNVQAADQLSRIRFTWERFYSTGQPPTDYPAPA